VSPDADIDALAAFLRRHPRVVALTGAGCSTASGIPDYRDEQGNWKPAPPVLGPEFARDAAVRERYWARSMVGWPRFAAARPNRAHAALAGLERRGVVTHTITQNVDGLHQRAGTRALTELHGALARVRCLRCDAALPRAMLQHVLLRDNPHFAEVAASAAPDGDARFEPATIGRFRVPACARCGGVLKPDVVFFGDPVPADRVQRCFGEVERADALLCVGTSLSVFSGYRFCRHAAATGKPVAAINLGRTRADPLLSIKLRRRCDEALEQLLEALSGQPDVPKALHRSEPPSNCPTMT